MNRREFSTLAAMGLAASPAATMQSNAAQAGGGQPSEQSFDFVVYGGTAAGVTTAVAAARQGLRVAMLEPRDHVGGMVTWEPVK
jgi:heterodisulfide reductase subunit A-like polyferredoxin